MTMRTGKGGAYKYYAYSNKMRTGATSCTGRSVPISRLDDLVLQRIKQEFVSVEAIKGILAPLTERKINLRKR